LLISLERGDLGGQRRSAPKARRTIDDRAPDGLGATEASRLKLGERAERLGVKANTDRGGHVFSVSQYVIQVRAAAVRDRRHPRECPTLRGGNGEQPLVEGLSGEDRGWRAIYRPPSRPRSAWV